MAINPHAKPFPDFRPGLGSELGLCVGGDDAFAIWANRHSPMHQHSDEGRFPDAVAAGSSQQHGLIPGFGVVQVIPNGFKGIPLPLPRPRVAAQFALTPRIRKQSKAHRVKRAARDFINEFQFGVWFISHGYAFGPCRGRKPDPAS